jgi:hypothetical protein
VFGQIFWSGIVLAVDCRCLKNSACAWLTRYYTALKMAILLI